MSEAFCPPFLPLHEILVDGESEHLILDHFTIDKEEARHFNIMSIMSFSHTSARLEEGTYMRLRSKNARTGEVSMSDTPNERVTNLSFIEHAHGNVLIGGLGLGMVVFPLLLKPEVRSIAIIEKDPEVIQLVSPQINNWIQHRWKIGQGISCPVAFFEGDAYSFLFPTGVKFQTIYMDIWGDMSTDDWEDIKAVKKHWRKFLDYKDPNHFNHCWNEDHILQMKKRENSWTRY